MFFILPRVSPPTPVEGPCWPDSMPLIAGELKTAAYLKPPPTERGEMKNIKEAVVGGTSGTIYRDPNS